MKKLTIAFGVLLLTGCEVVRAVSPQAGSYMDTARRYVINLADDPAVAMSTMPEIQRYCVENNLQRRMEIRSMYSTAKGPVIQVNCENF